MITVEAPARRCPDCAVAAVGRVLEHDAACPLGRALDDVRRRDRLWFRRHSARSSRRRAISWAEAQHTKLIGAPDVEFVQVTQLVPGIIARVGLAATP